MSLRTWSEVADIGESEIVSFNTVRVTRADDTNPNVHYVRQRVIMTRKWAGLDEDTALWMATVFWPDSISYAAQAGTLSTPDYQLYLRDAPTTGGAWITVGNFVNNIDQRIRGKNYFMIGREGSSPSSFADPTVYELQRDSWLQGVESLNSAITECGFLAVRPLDGSVYYTRPSTDAIYKVASGANSLVLSSGDYPIGIDIDETLDYIYFTEGGTSNKLRRCTLAGASATDLVTGLTAPRACKITASHIYWVENHATLGKVRRCNRDGSSVTDILTGLADPLGLAVDDVRDKFYVTFPTAGQIGSYNLDGSGGAVFASGLTTGLQDVCVDVNANVLYWTVTGNTAAGVYRCAMSPSTQTVFDMVNIADNSGVYGIGLRSFGMIPSDVSVEIYDRPYLVFACNTGAGVSLWQVGQDQHFTVSGSVTDIGTRFKVLPVKSAYSRSRGSPVYLFKPTGADSNHEAGGMYTFTGNYEFLTEETTVNEPEPA